MDWHKQRPGGGESDRALEKGLSLMFWDQFYHETEKHTPKHQAHRGDSDG